MSFLKRYAILAHVRALFLFLCTASSLFAKVHIFTIAYDSPEFIPLQHKSLQAFLIDEYTHTVYINASTNRTAQQLIQACKALNIDYHRLPISKDPSLTDHAKALSYALHHVIEEGFNETLLLENDCFLTRPLCLEEAFKDVFLAFVPRSVYTLGTWDTGPYGLDPTKAFYVNPQFVFLRIKQLPHIYFFNRWQRIHLNNMLLDTGGPTHHYLKMFPHLPQKHIDSSPFLFSDKEIQMTLQNAPEEMQEDLHALLAHNRDVPLQFFCNYSVLHFGGGCNWANRSYNYREKKLQLIETLIDNSINRHDLLLQ